MFDVEAASVLSAQIGEQADQLWSAAMALVVAEIYIACRFFTENGGKIAWRPTGILLAISIVCHLLSLLCGYFTKGALIIMIEKSAEGLETSGSYEAAETMAIIQFFTLSAGLLIFIVAFMLDFTGIAKAISKAK